MNNIRLSSRIALEVLERQVEGFSRSVTKETILYDEAVATAQEIYRIYQRMIDEVVVHTVDAPMEWEQL